MRRARQDTRRNGRAKTRTRPGPRAPGRPRGRRSGGSGPRCGRAEGEKFGAHPHSRVGLGPDQQLGWAHLVEHGVGRVLAPVGVVHHHGREGTAGRASTVMRSRGALIPAGPQKWVRWSASVMQAKTSSRGASNVRLKCSSACSATGRPRSLLGRLQIGQQGVELVEALVPQATVRRDPVQCAVERAGLQVAGPELGVAPPRNKAAALQHLEMLGDPRSDMANGRPARSPWHRRGPGDSRWRAGWGPPARRRMHSAWHRSGWSWNRS